MDFSLNENQKMIAQMVRDFAQKEILPYRNHWDEKQIFPVDVFKKMGELGLMGVLVPEEYGGAGFGYNEYVTAITELSKVCGGIGLSMAAHNSLCTNHIVYFGSEEQKRKFLPKLASGEWQIPIEKVLELADVPQAHADFETRRLMGRTLIKVGGDI